MPGNALIKASRLRSKMSIKHTGEEVSVERPDGTATTNKFGKVDDGDVTWTSVGDEFAYRARAASDEEPGRSRATGGRVRTDSPNILLPEDSVVQEGDRLTFDDGEQYIIDRLWTTGAHEETATTRLQ